MINPAIKSFHPLLLQCPKPFFQVHHPCNQEGSNKKNKEGRKDKKIIRASNEASLQT